MRRRHVSDMQLPRLNGMLANGSPDRIEYDYLFDVVEFMDERWPGVVSTGELVTHVRDMGWSTATRKVVGRSVSDVEAMWHTRLSDRAGREPECG